MGQLELQHLCLWPATAVMALNPGLALVSDQGSRGYPQDGPCLLKASTAAGLRSCFLLSLGEASHRAKDQGPTLLAGLLRKLTPVTLPRPPVLTGPPTLIRPVCPLPFIHLPSFPLMRPSQDGRLLPEVWQPDSPLWGGGREWHLQVGAVTCPGPHLWHNVVSHGVTGGITLGILSPPINWLCPSSPHRRTWP